MSNAHLQLLAELGIDIPESTWNSVHDIVPPEDEPIYYTTTLPTQPHHWEDDLPVFTSSQLEWAQPEVFGFDRYQVIEDNVAAHPLVLSYDDEQYYWGNHRPIHRYSRPYRLRWTLGHILGWSGKLEKEVEERLRQRLTQTPDVIFGRKAFEWVRAQLKKDRLTQLYMSIPYIVHRLGGPRWRVSFDVYEKVYGDALKLHHTFQQLFHQKLIRRQRFPKMQYVLLRLLDAHGVVPPYRVLWARTVIKRRQLGQFVLHMQDDQHRHQTTEKSKPQLSSEENGPNLQTETGSMGKQICLQQHLRDGSTVGLPTPPSSPDGEPGRVPELGRLSPISLGTLRRRTGTGVVCKIRPTHEKGRITLGALSVCAMSKGGGTHGSQGGM